MSRFVAVGDIHGCGQTLAKLLEILQLTPGDTLLSIGDLSSKGDDSKGVHDQLLALEERGINLILLLGNHEVMLLAMQRFLGANVSLGTLPDSIFRGAEISFLMRDNETWATLKSYGIEEADDPQFWAFRHDDPRRHFNRISQRLSRVNWGLPQAHLNLLSRCKSHHVERNCLFVHAGLGPAHVGNCNVKLAISSQRKEDPRAFFWNRDWLGTKPGFPELIVHGHTPLPYLHSFISDTTPWRDDNLVFKSVVHNGALNLDSGAFLDVGHLTAVEIPENGDPSEFRFIRVPRLDPVCKDWLWHQNYR
ncbi:MAG: metallophosphoesterase [bacterium]|nr:metallophosphoesterase [bacterium]